MKKFKEMKIGEDVTFFALVEALQKRYTPNKSAYYSVTVTDGDISIDARVWDVTLIEKINVSIGKVYYFTAHINEYMNKKQFVINSIREAEENEVNMKNFVKAAPIPEEQIRVGIKEYIKKIENEILRKLVIHIINTISREYFTYPGAMSMHHAYSSGLAYHTYSMLRLAEKLLEIYPGMNSDLLYAGVLLHDIGKAVDHDMEGSHIQLGVDLCKKYKETPVVINAVEAHHGDVEPESLIACIVQAADAISAARPGARRETLETYTTRLKQLEEIANGFKGVEKSYAIQAGREVRVMVIPEQISDDDMVLLARDMAKQIEDELQYPGQIKVNMIRESRVTDYAK